VTATLYALALLAFAALTGLTLVGAFRLAFRPRSVRSNQEE
jgi:hypothetical protein